MDHLLQPIFRLIIFQLFILLLFTLIAYTCKNPTPNPAWLQINTMTFAVLLVFLETALQM